MVPASVRIKLPREKSKAASPPFLGSGEPGVFQWSLPAIIRCMAMKRGPRSEGPAASSKTMRLPRRSTFSTRLPSAADGGGSNVRTTNGLATRIARSSSPSTLCFSAAT